MQFQPGQSGNPAGRPKGSGNKRMALTKLLDAHASTLLQKVIDMALEGDKDAIKLCIDRILPKARHQAIQLPSSEDLNLSSYDGIMTYNERLLDACSNGDVSPEEARQAGSLLIHQERLLGTRELEQRLMELEEQVRN